MVNKMRITVEYIYNENVFNGEAGFLKMMQLKGADDWRRIEFEHFEE
jgi:hypothetical protein